MRKVMAVTCGVSVIVGLLLVGCNSVERDWETAKRTGTSAAYTAFLAKHPQGAHTEDAKAAIEDLAGC
jgi:hypothetical protein